MVRFIINLTLFVMYLLLASIFYMNSFPWWTHLILGFGVSGIVVYTNISLDIIGN
jgi:hypothetical protein